VVGFAVTVGGMILFALLVAVVTDNVTKYMEFLRKGRSIVLESDHTLILGWNEKVAPLLMELSIANQSNGRNAVAVVLAEREKEEMEGHLAESCPDTQGTLVICRQGSPFSTGDLKRVSVTTARVVIILSDESGSAYPQPHRTVAHC